jgi:hypothetical protein
MGSLSHGELRVRRWIDFYLIIGHLPADIGRKAWSAGMVETIL